MANFTLDQTGQEIQDILDTVGNNQATSGQVLTADGTGGASWQNASGGKLYIHNISSANNVNFIIYTTNNTTFNVTSLAKFLYDIGCINRSSAISCSKNAYGGSSNSMNFALRVFSTDGTTISRAFEEYSAKVAISSNDIVYSYFDRTYLVSSITDTVTEL